MTSIEAMLAEFAKENNAEEAKRSKKYKAADAIKEAAFLKTWSKGKPIVRQTDDATFWAAGKWMTKLDYGMVDLIVKQGLGTVKGDTKKAGCQLTIKR